MTEKRDDGPEWTVTEPVPTLQQFAATKLRVPNSGLDWLDAMIRESQRDAFAGQALAGMRADHEPDVEVALYAKWSYEQADAMLVERERGEGR